MNIEEFVSFVNDKAEKKPKYGNEDYTEKDINSLYYKKLSVVENGITRCPKNRLSYEVVWDKDCKQRNIFILFNPSIANSDILDGTLKNCVKICYALKNCSKEKVECGGMLIYNTFTVRHPQIDYTLKIINKEYEYANNPVFRLPENYPNNISKLIVAWGNIAKTELDIEYFKCLKNLIDDIKLKGHKAYAYHKNKSGAKQPSHPSPRCSGFVRDFCDNPNLIEL